MAAGGVAFEGFQGRWSLRKTMVMRSKEWMVGLCRGELSREEMWPPMCSGVGIFCVSVDPERASKSIKI